MKWVWADWNGNKAYAITKRKAMQASGFEDPVGHKSGSLYMVCRRGDHWSSFHGFVGTVENMRRQEFEV